MKRIKIVIEMNDDAPEGVAVLEALGGLVREALVIVAQKSRVIDCWNAEYGVRVVTTWMPPKAGEVEVTFRWPEVFLEDVPTRPRTRMALQASGCNTVADIARLEVKTAKTMPNMNQAGWCDLALALAQIVTRQEEPLKSGIAG